VSYLRFDPVKYILTIDALFCTDHNAPSDIPGKFPRSEDEETVGKESASTENMSHILCFGKPVCYSCYHELQPNYKIPNDAFHLEEILPLVSCRCGKSIACRDCYYDSAENQQSFCNRCNNIRRKASRCKCEDCMDDETMHYEHDRCDSECYHTTRKQYEEEDKIIRLYSRGDIQNACINMVDWRGDCGFFEEVGIQPMSKLQSTVNRFLDLHQDTPADAFDLLQHVLVQQKLDVNTLNQSPSIDNKSRWTTPVRKREYFEALEITPGNGLAQLIALLLDRRT
jgi:hypothetical protein